MGIKNPLRHSLLPLGYAAREGQRVRSRSEALSEHEQRLLIPCAPELSAPTVTLTAAVHVLTSLAVYLV